MRIAAIVTAVVLSLIFVLTTFVHTQAARDAALRHFTLEECERGREHAMQRKYLSWSRSAVHLALLFALVALGAGRLLTDKADALTGGRWWLTVLLVAGTIFVIEQVLMFPWAVAGGWWMPKQWGLSDRGFVDWLLERVKGVGVTAAMGAIPLLGLFAILRWFPERWWMIAAAGAGVFGVAVAFLMPVIIAPLFNTFTPIGETEWAPLKPRFLEIAARAGVPVSDVLVADASRQGRYSNAYFTGFGSTQRIVLYDTLLRDHPADEVESIVGHEVGHWQHAHIVKGLLMGTAGVLVAFFLLSKILTWAMARPEFAIRSIADPACLPLILLLGALGNWVAAPIQSAVSRHFERQADDAALELAGKPEAFIEAEKRLVRTNISDPAPAPIAVFLFASHPPAVDRIEAARRWRVDNPDRP